MINSFLEFQDLSDQAMKRILFLCSQNKLRSPTAEKIFSEYPDLEVASAGFDIDAKIKVTKELIEWADFIFVMEKNHENRSRKSTNNI